MEDALQFFQAETMVVTASKMERNLSQSPSTVYVVTGEEIIASGAQTLFDALRGVPGIDVVATRAMQGEVNARGLSSPFNNRMLVLVDGRTVLNNFFDFVTWETIPVSMEEIDRIEIVEGPVSSLYGANAISGVINIITKSPEDLENGVLSTAIGNRDTVFTTLVHGRQLAKLGYRASVTRRASDDFESSGNNSRVVKGNAFLEYKFNEDLRVSFEGGNERHENETVSAGALGRLRYDGFRSYLRSDVAYRNSKFRIFWNRGRATGRKFPGTPNIDFDTFDIEVEQHLALPHNNTMIAGASVRKNYFRSNIFSGNTLTQDLWAIFVQNEWKPTDTFTAILSGRLDRHPFTGINASPGGSIIYSPVPGHTFRLSGGTSFRNPTFTENFLNLTAGPITFLGNQGADSEKIATGEIAYSQRFERVKNRLIVFLYEIRDAIEASPPNPRVFGNGGRILAYGTELSTELFLHANVSAKANYSFERLRTRGLVDDTLSVNAPRHKINTGLNYHRDGFSVYAWTHWVRETEWNTATVGTPPALERVPDYVLLNTNVAYTLPGSLKHVELSLSVFNLFNDVHFEFPQGLGGEKIGRRILGKIRIQF